MSSTNSLIYKTDSYKVSHERMYPPENRYHYSYLEAREGATYPSTVFFGLQYVLHKHFLPDARLPDTNSAPEFWQSHFQNSRVATSSWRALQRKHGSVLPIEIRAVPEGTIVPVGNVLLTIENTDHEFPWLVGWVEAILQQLWYPCSVATRSLKMKQILKGCFDTYCEGQDVSQYLHDFGLRGCTCVEQASIGGAAHLLNFVGSDNVPAIQMVAKYYSSPCVGKSIPAAEHSVIMSWGRSREKEAYEHILNVYPEGPVAIPIDTYDMDRTLGIFTSDLREKILSRKGVVILRPDSGDPCETVPHVLRRLANGFGSNITPSGKYVLHPNVRGIQGDHIDEITLPQILGKVVEADFSPENIYYGSGNGLLHKNLTRDTQRFAFKLSSVENEDRQRIDVAKQPVTDLSKSSKAGRFALVPTKNGLQTVQENAGPWKENLLSTVFRNGVLVRRCNFDEIATRLRQAGAI